MRGKKAGFTLIEFMVYLVLFGMVLALGYRIFFYGNNTFVMSSNKFQLTSDLRLATDFITSETRNATELDVISLPFIAQSDYYYIYMEDSKIIFEFNGNKNEKTGSIIVDQNIFEITKDANNRNYMGINLCGMLDGKSYESSTSILLNNIINKNSQTGKAIKYKKP